MLQINYWEKYIIDLGWYPSWDPNGSFTIRVIRNCDWIKPLFIKKFKEITLVEQNIQQCADFISILMQKEKKKFKKRVNLKGGVIIRDDFNFYENEFLTPQQPDAHHMQLSYDNKKYILDVEWQPHKTPTGAFIIQVIKNTEGEQDLVFNQEITKLDLLAKKIQEAVDFIVPLS